jgi:23S rRNA-/tRNA-specific pseudouridylate synthase
MNLAKSSIASQLKSVLYKDKGMLVLNKLPGLTCQLATGKRNSHWVWLTSPSQVGGTNAHISSRT